jgi:hypothetical protein
MDQKKMIKKLASAVPLGLKRGTHIFCVYKAYLKGNVFINLWILLPSLEMLRRTYSVTFKTIRSIARKRLVLMVFDLNDW